MPAARLRVLTHVTGLIPPSPDGDCVLVGIDGGDGAGKTIFANDLAALAAVTSRPTVRISLDDFHNPRAIRYRQGRSSPTGFYQDSFNYKAFLDHVLTPCGPGGSRRYRPRAHDLTTDEVLDEPEQCAAPGTIIIVDGLFLHRAELREHWDFTVFLDVAFEITAQRMAQRDGSHPDPFHPSMARYTEAQLLYRAECDPARRASLVIDNSDPAAPLLR